VTYRRAVWLVDVLRAAGITVTEVPGWSGRGLSEAIDFDPRAVVWHHDASAPGDSPGVIAFMLRNFATGAAQCWVDRQGRWHILAAGRCAHAGVVLKGMPDNSTSIGVETDHTTGEAWPEIQLRSLRVGSAAILRHLEQDAGGLHFHKTICSPPGRKIDPAGLTLSAERAAVAEILLPEVSVAAMQAAWERDRRRVLGLHPVMTRRVQRALGFTVPTGRWGRATRARFGSNGPTEATLKALGRGKFRVVE